MSSPTLTWRAGCIWVAIAAASMVAALWALEARFSEQLATLREPINLGLAWAPPDTTPDGGRWYQWAMGGPWPRPHEVGYWLEAEEAQAVLAAERRIAREVGYRPRDGGTFTLSANRGCRADLGCVYQKIASTNEADVAPLTRRFLEHAKKKGLTQRELAALIVTFVQHLEYAQPDRGVPFGVYPPALVAADGWGDCDSKALLAAMMLKGVGIDAVLLSSQRFAHAAVGVALPGEGMRVRGPRREYLYWEVTRPSWPAGMIDPKIEAPSHWRVVEL